LPDKGREEHGDIGGKQPNNHPHQTEIHHGVNDAADNGSHDGKRNPDTHTT